MTIKVARAIFNEKMDTILYFDGQGPSSIISKMDIEIMVLRRVVVVVRGRTKPENRPQKSPCGRSRSTLRDAKDPEKYM